MNNFRCVPDSCHREEGKSLRDFFERVRVDATFCFGMSGFGWVIGPLIVGIFWKSLGDDVFCVAMALLNLSECRQIGISIRHVKRGVTERGVLAFAYQYAVSPHGRTGNRTVTQMRHPLLRTTKLRATIACQYTVGPCGSCDINVVTPSLLSPCSERAQFFAWLGTLSEAIGAVLF